MKCPYCGGQMMPLDFARGEWFCRNPNPDNQKLHCGTTVSQGGGHA